MSDNETVMQKLRRAIRSARLERADFTGSGHPKNKDSVPYPTNESEVTAFIKDRVRLHHSSWIVEPIEEVMAMLGQE